MGSKTQLVATLTLAAALGAACTNGDATSGEVVDTLTNAGVNEADANCVGNRLDDGLTQEELNNVAGVDDLDELSGDDVAGSEQDLKTFVETSIAECGIGSAPSEGSDSGEGSSSGDEGSTEGNEGSQGSSEGSGE